MNKLPLLFVVAFVFSLSTLAQTAVVTGELKKFHKVTLTWEGAELTEAAATFKDYRLNITFSSPSGLTYVVPGYYAADGNAAESSATSGNKWRCHFNPVEIGTWSYNASFRTAENIALSFDPSAGNPIGSIDGDTGTFEIAETDKTGLDFRSKGKLEYVGEHYLRWSNDEYFLKLGTNTPEVFLEYVDFDNSPQNPRPGFLDRDYAAHIPDWQVGNPTWQGTKGKGIIGAVNYLSGQGINAHYFLTDSSYGDTDTVFPWVSIDEHYVFDVSKLDQWQIVFDHMMHKGVKVHFVLSEAEQQSLFELFADAEGDPLFADARKIYFRELVARFGYLNAITWNLGEENGWDRPTETYGRGLTSQQQIDFADYIDKLTYYNDHITLQNGHANDDGVFANLVGDNALTGASLQGVAWNTQRSRASVLNWKEKSALANKKWVVNYDEAYTSGFSNAFEFREKSLWACLTAGAAGFEYYVPQNTWDWRIQDYSPYEEFWAYMDYAKDFFENNNIPFHEMENKNQMVSNGWCFGKDYETYVIYIPSQGTTTAQITGEYSVKWFDPRNGGPLLDGSVISVSDGSNVNIGVPPNNPDLDWVVLLQTIQSGPVSVTGISVTPTALSIGTGQSIQLTGNILPGNADNTELTWSSGNPSIASVDADGQVTAHAVGNVSITATSDEGNFTDSSLITVLDSSNFCSATGTILMERYDGITGTDLNSLINAASYPDNPTSTLALDKFQIPTNAADQYGTRVSGYLCAPESGTYYFWIAGDDNTQLNISTDTNPLNSTTIAYHNSWTGSEEWDKFATQKSVGIELFIGQTYYIEAIMKEGGGGDNLAVAWRKPSNGTGNVPSEIIPGTVLSSDLPTPVPVTGVSVNPDSATLESGSTLQLTASVSPSGADNTALRWSSNDTDAATVDTNGLVTAVNEGTVTITVTTEDGGFTATTSITITATPVPVTGVSVSPDSATLESGSTVQLIATVSSTGADNTALRWSSNDTDAATVDTNGLVTAVNEGAATITVTTEDGGFTATTSITVMATPVPVTGVRVSPDSATLESGSTLQLTASVSPTGADNTALRWSSNDTGVATVDTNGLVTAVNEGTVTITVTTEDGAFSATAIINVENLKILLDAEAMIYPNPSKDMAHVKFSGAANATLLKVYDTTGREILNLDKEQFEVQNDLIRFSVLPLKDATYFIHVLTDDAMKRMGFRLIVKK